MSNETTAPSKPYLSPTQLDMAAKCGMQYQFRYVDGLKIPPAVAMVAPSGENATPCTAS